jgi:hypothetical protein
MIINHYFYLSLTDCGAFFNKSDKIPIINATS